MNDISGSRKSRIYAAQITVLVVERVEIYYLLIEHRIIVHRSRV
jgi:hypothetical protein